MLYCVNIPQVIQSFSHLGMAVRWPILALTNKIVTIAIGSLPVQDLEFRESTTHEWNCQAVACELFCFNKYCLIWGEVKGDYVIFRIVFVPYVFLNTWYCQTL